MPVAAGIVDGVSHGGAVIALLESPFESVADGLHLRLDREALHYKGLEPILFQRRIVPDDPKGVVRDIHLSVRSLGRSLTFDVKNEPIDLHLDLLGYVAGMHLSG